MLLLFFAHNFIYGFKKNRQFALNFYITLIECIYQYLAISVLTQRYKNRKPFKKVYGILSDNYQQLFKCEKWLKTAKKYVKPNFAVFSWMLQSLIEDKTLKTLVFCLIIRLFCPFFVLKMEICPTSRSKM